MTNHPRRLGRRKQQRQQRAPWIPTVADLERGIDLSRYVVWPNGRIDLIPHGTGRAA